MHTRSWSLFLMTFFCHLDLDGIMSFCYCGAQGHQDETCRQDPEIYMPPCHPILPPPHPHLPPQPSRSTAHPPGKKGDKGRWDELFFFQWNILLVVIFFGGVFINFVSPPLEKSYTEYRYFPIPDSWQNQGGLSSKFHKDQQVTGELLI